MRMILIGFMGAGKTVIGKKVAAILDMEFIDMDEEIEKNEDMSINNIFKSYGEKYFRELEKNLLKELINRDNAIISTGGGVVEYESNCEILKLNEKVVFLQATPETIIEHLKNSIEKRPLLKNSENPEDTVRKLLENRQNKYIDVSNIVIDVNNKSIEEVVNDLLVCIK